MGRAGRSDTRRPNNTIGTTRSGTTRGGGGGHGGSDGSGIGARGSYDPGQAPVRTPALSAFDLFELRLDAEETLRGFKFVAHVLMYAQVWGERVGGGGGGAGAVKMGYGEEE